MAGCATRCKVLTAAALWLVLCISGAGAAKLPPEVIQALDRYQQLLDEALRERRDAVAELGQTYLGHLGRLETQLREEGDLDGILAVRRESERFEQEEVIRDEHRQSEPETLALLQQRYMQARAQQLQEIMQRIVRLSESFTGALERFEQQLVVEDRIPEAQAVRAERETVARNVFVREARQALAAQQEPKPPPRKAEPTPPPTTKLVRLPAGIYRPGDEPARDLDSLMMRFTSTRSRAVATRANAEIGIYVDSEDERGSRQRSSWSTSRMSSGTYTYYPRLRLALPPIHDLDQGIVVFEYFSQPLDGRGNFTRTRTEHIHLPPMKGGDTLIVDGAGVQHYQYQHEFRSRHSRYRSATRRGASHYGLIVSVYNGQGEMVYQRTDRQPLASEASDTLPEPLNDRLGEVYDASRDASRIHMY